MLINNIMITYAILPRLNFNLDYEGMRVLKVKVISLPYIFQVLYVLCFTRPRYQVSVYRTILTILTIYSLCILTICNISYVGLRYVLVLRAGFGF